MRSRWRGPSERFHEWFLPILQRHRVTLVISGHEHHYERSRRIAGIPYIVTGGGGAPLTPVKPGPETRFAAAVHHFLILEVVKDEMTAKA